MKVPQYRPQFIPQNAICYIRMITHSLSFCLWNQQFRTFATWIFEIELNKKPNQKQTEHNSCICSSIVMTLFLFCQLRFLRGRWRRSMSTTVPPRSMTALDVNYGSSAVDDGTRGIRFSSVHIDKETTDPPRSMTALDVNYGSSAVDDGIRGSRFFSVHIDEETTTGPVQSRQLSNEFSKWSISCE